MRLKLAAIWRVSVMIAIESFAGLHGSPKCLSDLTLSMKRTFIGDAEGGHSWKFQALEDT